MFAEFAKYQVFPLDASVATRMVAPRPVRSRRPQDVHLLRHAVTGMPRGDGAHLLNTSYTITAEVEVPEGGARA